MHIQNKDTILLWSRACGRCSFPGCSEDLTLVFEKSGPTIIGEMAHVIARQPKGPRGSSERPSNINSYDNLILLCPTHHTLIDKAPEDFPPEVIVGWKAEHEKRVQIILESPYFANFKGLCGYINRILEENGVIHKLYGPESALARQNPIGEGVEFWKIRKLTVIVPNNRKIVNAFKRNIQLIPPGILREFFVFQEHAETFERNCYTPRDGSGDKRFPPRFAEIVREGKDGCGMV